MFPIYVINLPHHKDRLELFCETNDFLLNYLSVFSACDGRKLPRRQQVLEGIITEKNNYDARSLGILKSHVELWKIAAQSEHGITIMEDDVIIHKDFLNACEKIIQQNSSFDLIAWAYNLDWPIRLETAQGLPTALISHLVEVGTSEELVLYGQFGEYGNKIDSSLYLSQTINDFSLVKTTMFTGLCCYTLSPQGAKKLLQQLPIDTYHTPFYGTRPFVLEHVGIDITMSHFYPDMNVFLASPFLGYSGNKRAQQ